MLVAMSAVANKRVESRDMISSPFRPGDSGMPHIVAPRTGSAQRCAGSGFDGLNRTHPSIRRVYRARPVLQSLLVSDVVVIGAGAFGAWAAHHLAEAGAQVTLVDAYGPGNSRSSSGDESRILRCGYAPDEIYSRF